MIPMKLPYEKFRTKLIGRERFFSSIRRRHSHIPGDARATYPLTPCVHVYSVDHFYYVCCLCSHVAYCSCECCSDAFQKEDARAQEMIDSPCWVTGERRLWEVRGDDV